MIANHAASEDTYLKSNLPADQFDVLTGIAQTKTCHGVALRIGYKG